MSDFRKGFENLFQSFHVLNRGCCSCNDFGIDYGYFADFQDTGNNCNCNDSCDLYGVRVDIANTKNPLSPENTIYYVDVFAIKGYKWSFEDEDASGLEFPADAHFEEYHRQHAFTVQKCDDYGWEPKMQEFAKALEEITMTNNDYISGFFSNFKDEYTGVDYRSGFEMCLNWMAANVPNCDKNTVCPHISSKK